MQIETLNQLYIKNMKTNQTMTYPIKKRIADQIVGPITMVSAIATFLAVPAFQAQGGFASQGSGMGIISNGSVANGALYMETRSTWTNLSSTAKPYIIEQSFSLPVCDQVAASHLVMTIWGGTANYTCNLGLQINGTNLPATPFLFGSTNDTNPIFSTSAPNVYGSGSGVWVVGLPIPSEMLYKNGNSNQMQVTINTPDSFDGRINQMTLIAVYQKAALNNIFEYAIAEGAGDIYKSPTGAQLDQRIIPLGTFTPTNAITAQLKAVYTYGDINQNDRLYFNNTQLGGEDVANYDKTAAGLDYGPNVVSFDVLGSLMSSNVVKFSVSSTDIIGTRETSLRPEIAALGVTFPAQSPALAIDMNIVITWPVSATAYQVQQSSNVESGDWTTVTNTPAVINGQNVLILPRTSPQQFYRLFNGGAR